MLQNQLIMSMSMSQLNNSNSNSHKVLDEMLIAAKLRCRIPNANNGRAYMGCIILDRWRPL